MEFPNDKIWQPSKNEKRRERRLENEMQLKETNFAEWQRKRDARNERKRINNQKLKEENPILWQQKRDARNEQRRERRKMIRRKQIFDVLNLAHYVET